MQNSNLALTTIDQPETWLDLDAMHEALVDTFTDDFQPNELDRVAFTGATKAQWKLPTINGQEEHPFLEGIIVHHHTHRIMYAADYGKRDEVQKQVLCASRDGLVGHGEPGCACKGCPMNVWVKRPNGTFQPKACSERMYVYLLRPGMTVPVRVDLSSTSVKVMTTYFNNLKKAGLAPWKVITALCIGEETRASTSGKKGDPFSVVAPRMDQKLSRLEWVALQAYRAKLLEWLKPWLTYEDQAVTEGEPETEFPEVTYGAPASKSKSAKGPKVQEDEDLIPAGSF